MIDVNLFVCFKVSKASKSPLSFVFQNLEGLNGSNSIVYFKLKCHNNNNNKIALQLLQSFCVALARSLQELQLVILDWL